MNKTEKVYFALKKEYPNAKCGLDYETPFQLLISTVLSAQATDKSVNAVTEELYKEYPDVDAFLTLSLEELSEKIKKIGLYRNKSKNIYALCQKLEKDFNKEVPKTMEELTSLPGVGRKTASVVLAEAFKIPAFPVDTHILRISGKLGISNSTTPDKVSDDIMAKLPKKYWIEMHHLMITHGRNICVARKPECEKCVLADICNFYKKEKKNV